MGRGSRRRGLYALGASLGVHLLGLGWVLWLREPPVEVKAPAPARLVWIDAAAPLLEAD